MWGHQGGYGDVTDMGTAVGSWGQQWGYGDISGVMGTAVMGGTSEGTRGHEWQWGRQRGGAIGGGG